jgi:glycosyltransferase involved in cell wall biosynthesis
MNILLVCPEYPPRNIGGGGIVYKSIANELKKKGHKVRVIAGNLNCKQIVGQIELIYDQGVPVHFIPLILPPKFRNFDVRTYTPPTITGIAFLIKELIQSRKEVIHLHGLCHPLVDLAAFTCMLTRKKYVFTCHGIPKSPRTSGSFWRFILKSYLSIIEKIVIKRAAMVTTVSNSLLKECLEEKLTNKMMVVIINGVNTELQLVKPKPIGEFEKKYRLKGKRIVFAIGRLNQNKGFQHLINAMIDVTQRIPAAMAIIAGTGPYKERLQEQIYEKNLTKKVKLVGWISEEEKATFYKYCDTVVFPSLQEPFGLVILEALAMHKPVIAFNTETATQLLDNGFNSLLVPLADEKKLAATITRILEDKTLQEKIIANTYTKIRIFEWNKIIKKYINTYRKAYAKNEI